MPRRTCHDDYPLLAQGGHPAYPGLPGKLHPEGLARAQALLLAGQNCCEVANELGYVSGVSFGWAFLQIVGERPGAWQRRHGVKARSRRGGLHAAAHRSLPDRSDQVPLPRYTRRPTSIPR